MSRHAKVGQTVTTGQQSLVIQSGGESRTLFASQFTVLVDRSASMSTPAGDGKSRMDVATEAFGSFVKKVTHKEDRVCVFTYNGSPEFVLSEPAPKVNLRAKALRSKLVAAGGTDMPKAIEAAIANMRRFNDVSKKRTKGKVVNWLVVFTDGDAAGYSHTHAQVLAMLGEASRTIWNFKVCFIGIGQSRAEEAVLREMAGAVQPRLRTEGGLVLSTAGTDAASLRRVFEAASTRIEQLQARIQVDNGDGGKVQWKGADLAEGMALVAGQIGGLSLVGGTQRLLLGAAPAKAGPTQGGSAKGKQGGPAKASAGAGTGAGKKQRKVGTKVTV